MSPREMVHDLLQFSVEAPECRHRTCLSIRLNGKKIDNFVELGSVEGLKSGCTIELVEGVYSAMLTSLDRLLLLQNLTLCLM